MDSWIALAIFLLGAGAGALVTAIFYSAQIRDVKRLLTANSGENSSTEKQNIRGSEERRKSA